MKQPLMPLEQALLPMVAAAHAQRASMQGAESIATFDALGRVLAADVVSPIDVPGADNTSMDGYALRAADVTTVGTRLPVAQRVPAGTAPQPLQPGTAARIFTGAFIPEGADAVVMQEQCIAADGLVQINAKVSLGQWVRRAGEDVRKGDTVLPRGALLTPQAMGLVAGVGAASVMVWPRVRVALMSTGDELVMPGTVAPDALPVGAIFNSNRFMLHGLLRACGCVVTDFGIVPDKLDATREALRQAAQTHDLLITSGGVSVGEEDHIRPAVQAQGHLDLWQLAIKPGKPLAFGSIRREGGTALFLGLPGNPVSSFVTFLLAAMPVIRALQGLPAQPLAATSMRADFEWTKPDTQRREFLRARRNAAGGLDLFNNQSSGVLTSTVWGDGLVDVPAGQTIQRGASVPFLPWSTWGLA
jgi:molybdopterin molybdotransferase